MLLITIFSYPEIAKFVNELFEALTNSAYLPQTLIEPSPAPVPVPTSVLSPQPTPTTTTTQKKKTENIIIRRCFNKSTGRGKWRYIHVTTTIILRRKTTNDCRRLFLN